MSIITLWLFAGFIVVWKPEERLRWRVIRKLRACLFSKLNEFFKVRRRFCRYSHMTSSRSRGRIQGCVDLICRVAMEFLMTTVGLESFRATYKRLKIKYFSYYVFTWMVHGSYLLENVVCGSPFLTDLIRWFTVTLSASSWARLCHPPCRINALPTTSLRIILDV